MILENLKETEFGIQFLGIRLRFDDLLILGVLYLLYIEQVENQFLFIILILLLLS